MNYFTPPLYRIYCAICHDTVRWATAEKLVEDSGWDVCNKHSTEPMDERWNDV